jgi:general secretion pathway protein B
MSSILKALKKVENDNASRRPDELRINAEILRADSASKFSSSGMLLISLFLVAFGAGGTYLYMTRDNATESKRTNSSTVSGQMPPPTAAIPEITEEQLPPAIVVAPAKQQIVVEAKKTQIPPPASLAKSAPPVAKQPAVAAQPVVVTSPGTAPLTAPPPVAVPALRVNGIALQDDSSGSVAMINGEPVASGGIIAGVKVVEIYKNRVKFSYKGETFEVLLGQSNR